jgi:CubicO group peptidase (beta-lactamase class C family)
MKKAVISVFLLLCLSSCKVGRFVYYNFADITDHKVFPNRTIENDSTDVFYFKNSTEDNFKFKMTDGSSFETFLEDNHTVAFLVIQNDTIKYQNYFNDYNESSIVASFSMAKSFTSFLIGCAIEDGLIQSVNDPVTDYIPEMRENGFDKVSIENLLQMTSGLKFNESYVNPFGHAATFYYGRNLRKVTQRLKLEKEPGTRMQYVSGDTQILGLLLDRVLADKTISQYLEEKLWTKTGMQYDASWSIDKKKNGLEKTFCCLNARAIDFAKFGRLYLNHGNWEGQQLISEDWVKQSTKVDTLNGSYKGYQYQWWIPNDKGDFIAEGILGQFIFVSPSENLIIVRLGEKYGNVNWESAFEKIKEVLKTYDKRIAAKNKIQTIRERLENSMLDYITPGVTAYDETDVETCMKILDEHLDQINECQTKEEALKLTENTILKLNDLNKKTNYELVETTQREDIAEIIILAGFAKGFNTKDEDITEEWREW